MNGLAKRRLITTIISFNYTNTSSKRQKNHTLSKRQKNHIKTQTLQRSGN